MISNIGGEDMDCMRVSRGQVFMYDPLCSVCTIDNQPVRNIKVKGHLMQKERPYLVVSNNKCNAANNIVTVVPIATREKEKLPVQVKFLFEGRPQVILVDKICTANIGDLGKYLYTISNELLDRVVEAIMLQVGYEVKTSNMILDNFIYELNKIVHRISEDAKKKNSLVDGKQMTEITNNILKVITENFPEDTFCDEGAIVKEEKNCEKKMSRLKYSTEDRKQLLIDYQILSITEFMEKYHCFTKKAATDRVYYAKKRLQAMGVDISEFIKK